jgi:hypothetical protein
VRGSTYSNMSDENISHDCWYKFSEEHPKVQSVNDIHCARGRAFQFRVTCQYTHFQSKCLLTVLVYFDGTSHSTSITFD